MVRVRRKGIGWVQLALAGTSYVDGLPPRSGTVRNHELAIVQSLLILLIRVMNVGIHRRRDEFLEGLGTRSEHEWSFPHWVQERDYRRQGIYVAARS